MSSLTPSPENVKPSMQMFLEKFCPENLSSSSWVIRNSELSGRGLFADKKIKKGDLIFTNKPLATGPRQSDYDISFCAYCYGISDDYNFCDKCGLSVCSKSCKTSPMHLKECMFITANWKPKSSLTRNIYITKTLGRIRIYIKFLLLTFEQKELLLLLQHDNPATFQELDNLNSEFRIPDEQINFMKTVHSILKINSFRIPTNNPEKLMPLRGLFPLASFLNHSCVPNTRNKFKNDNTMEVYAARDIEKGEELLSCYTSLLWCTPVRRYQLYHSKNFWCKCKRCSDVLEMGTRMSALKCFNKECVGLIMPQTPLNLLSNWHCDTCHIEIPVKQISSVQCVVGSLVRLLLVDDEINFDNRVFNRLESFLPSFSYIFVDINFKRALKLGYAEGMRLCELSESRLVLKENLCRDTLRTAAALGAGDAHLRGLLLYHLHAALAERARRYPDLYEDLKSEIESTISQAYNILQGDISAPPDLELRRQYLGPGCEKTHEERFFILDTSDDFKLSIK